MANTLSDMKSALKGGGARPNLFEISIPTLPSNITWDSTKIPIFKALCKAAALPATNLGVIDFPYRSRTLKLAGDRTFDTWTITLVNDNDFTIRNAMEQWVQLFAQYGDGSGFVNPADYMVDAYVKQLTREPTVQNQYQGKGLETTKQVTITPQTGTTPQTTTSTIVGKYKFIDIFPTNISQIDLSYDSTDTIEEFTVDFQVNYWYPVSTEDDD